MEDSNSSQPSKCPCGFWGSSNTMGLCSRCYKEHLQSKESMQSSASGKPGLSSKDNKPTSSNLRVPPKVPSTASTSKGENLVKSSTPHCDSTTPGASSRLHGVTSPVKPQNKSNSNLNTDINKDSAKNDNYTSEHHAESSNKVEDDRVGSSAVIGSDTTTQDNLSTCSSTDSLSSMDTEKRGTKRSIGDVQDTSGKSPQKSKRRCNVCSCKLELAQRTIGQCRCGYVFCPLHRLPELHNCDFDHKEDGRREARDKMLKPTRHVGNSCKRIDS